MDIFYSQMCEINNTHSFSYIAIFYGCSSYPLCMVDKIQKDRWLVMNGSPRFIQGNLLSSYEFLNVTLLLVFCQKVKMCLIKIYYFIVHGNSLIGIVFKRKEIDAKEKYSSIHLSD